MTTDSIRLRHSGFVIFAARIVSIATGIVFTLLVTRNTSSAGYGVWNNVFDVAAYFTIFAGAFPFWITRFVARGKKGSEKSGLLSSLVVGLIPTTLYLALVSLITSALHVGQEYLPLYFIVSAQILETHVFNALEAILQAKKPQAVGYGLLIEESVKIILAFIIIVGFRQPLLGAIISIILSLLVQILYYIRLLSADLRLRIEWNYVKEWLKGSTGYLYYIIGLEATSYVYIFLFTYGGQAARGDYGAGSTIATIITYSSFLSYALYPRLLDKSSTKDVATSLKLVLLFAIPMTLGAIVLSNSLIAALNETYAGAGLVLVVLAIDALTAILFGFITSVIFGIEKFDQEAKISFRQLAKSRIFKVWSLSYVQAAITLPPAFFILTYTQTDPLRAALYVSVIKLSADLATFLISCFILRGMIRIDIPWKIIAKYVFGSTVMVAILFVIPHSARLSSIAGLIALGTVIYIILLTIIDKEAKSLFNSIWQEIKLTLKRTTT